MSQVSYKTTWKGFNIEVVGGYDNPLKGYHFTIYNLDSLEDETFYCNLEEKLAFPKTNDSFKKITAGLGIDLPDHFWDACDMKAGNIQLYWNPLTESYDSRRI
jgi:hypothetical protein